MDKVINRFVWLLRQRDVRISPAEIIDALRALGELPISDRAAVKAALSGTLIKDQRATGVNVYIDEPYPQIAENPPVVVASSFSLTSLFK